MSDYIAFPTLGWRFSISDTLAEFSLFGMEFSIKWYMVLVLIGFLLALIYAYARIKKFGLDPDRMFDVVTISTVAAIVGARLYYILFAPAEIQEVYFADPVQMLLVWDGNFGLFGGILVAFLAGALVCRWRKVDTWAMFDLAATGLLIGQAVGRWGDFFHQTAFGVNTDLPWGMTGSEILLGTSEAYNPLKPVHPTFLYEFLWCVLGFLLLHLLSQKCYKFKGQLFGIYLIWYGCGRFVIEGLYVDSLYLGTMRVSQVFAVAAVIVGALVLILRRAKQNATAKELTADEPSAYSYLLDDEEEQTDASQDGDEEAVLTEKEI